MVNTYKNYGNLAAVIHKSMVYSRYMQTLTIDTIKQKAIPVLKKAGVTRSALFGSYVRGEQQEHSDIDFLVEYPPHIDLFAIGELKENLEEALGKNVDLVGYSSIKTDLKKYILQEQLQIL